MITNFNLRLKQLLIIFNIYLAKGIYNLSKTKDEKETWIIIERGYDARDNAFFFFEFLSKKKISNVQLKYIIDKKSVDYDKVKNIGEVVNYGSFEHFRILNQATTIVSTHANTFIPYQHLLGKFIKKGLINYNHTFIFLQHGIIKEYLPELCYPQSKFDLFICGSKIEFDYVKKFFNHPNHVVNYTGLARFDNLHSFKTKKQILLMPTWRKFLSNQNEKEFQESNYYQTYNNLLNNDELYCVLKATGYKLIFYPHYEVQKFLHLFSINNDVIELASFNDFDVQQLLKESELLITDYSSVFFDFAYMRKPIIYYQFDQNEYYINHYKKGYFDFENMGFGPVVKKQKDAIEEIRKSINCNNKLEAKYFNNITNFFPMYDNKNCERIYNKILEKRNLL